MKKFLFVLALLCLIMATCYSITKQELETLRVLIERMEKDQTNIVFKGNGISLRYSTYTFPTIYQGGFTLANQLTIITLNPILKFYYDHMYDSVNTIENYKDLMLLSSEDLLYKDRRYRGKFLIVPENGYYLLINLVSMEDYLRAVVPSEMPSSWHMEALKAQAIAARTYAIRVAIERRKKQQIFDLYSTVLDQAYYGKDKETSRTDQAVLETKDLIILYDNQPIWALYHSNCGGHTLDGRLVFKNRIESSQDYLSSTDCPYQGKKWNLEIEIYNLAQILQKVTKNKVYSIENVYTNSFKTYIVYNQGVVYSLYNWELRKMIGYSKIRSPYFTHTVLRGGNVLFEGVGFGHGVGMCQFGANELAKRGFTYKEIVKYYYKNVEITEIGRWLENANI
ncbi:MAG: SpoIID/LytB domain-containing protein [bacterium]